MPKRGAFLASTSWKHLWCTCFYKYSNMVLRVLILALFCSLVAACVSSTAIGVATIEATEAVAKRQEWIIAKDWDSLIEKSEILTVQSHCQWL